jgi:NAD(P)-dependent dehydrogenase (short-subunit alcohol dehydrogenase family)
MDLGLAGIGRAIAVQFAKEGANVAITYREDVKSGNETAQFIQPAGGNGMVTQMDLESTVSVEQVVETVVRDSATSMYRLTMHWIGPSEKVPFKHHFLQSFQRKIGLA